MIFPVTPKVKPTPTAHEKNWDKRANKFRTNLTERATVERQVSELIGVEVGYFDISEDDGGLYLLDEEDPLAHEPTPIKVPKQMRTQIKALTDRYVSLCQERDAQMRSNYNKAVRDSRRPW